MTYIVGFCGPAQVGKTTTAKALVKMVNERNDINIKVDHYAFALPLYEACSKLVNIPVEILESAPYKDTPWNEENSPLPFLVGWSPRKFLQVIGTDLIRTQIHNDFWLESAIRNVKDLDIAFMADARFPNEFERCDYLIELSRDGIQYACNHPSAMPPDEKFVAEKVDLFHEIDLKPLLERILQKYREFNNGIYQDKQDKMFALR